MNPLQARRLPLEKLFINAMHMFSYSPVIRGRIRWPTTTIVAGGTVGWGRTETPTDFQAVSAPVGGHLSDCSSPAPSLQTDSGLPCIRQFGTTMEHIPNQ